MKSKEIGALGEKMAENYLKEKGYQILDKNYFFRIEGNPRKGEIDVIVQKDGIISFVEVKSLRDKRGMVSQFSPEEKINFGKKRKLIKTAESWLMKKRISLNSKWQIDIIAIKMINNKKPEIFHFPNAIPYQ